MAQKHVSGNYKQKNKKFKGTSNKNKHKNPGKIETTQSTGVTKKINKKEQTKSDRKNQLDQIKQNKQEAKYIQTEKDIVNNQFFETGTKEKLFNTLKNIKPPRIIALVPFNEKANAFNIKNGLEQYITNLMAQNEEINMDQQNNTNQNTLSFKFPYFQFFANPKTMQGLVQENFLFAACDRNLQSTLDILKVADIVCPILSCADCKLEETNLDPYGKAGAFDDYAYRVMSCLRLQGMPPTINILQDSQMFQGDKKNKVKKLFQRFFAGEFSNEMVTLEDEATILPYLRKLQTTPLQSLTWREDRGYMLADKVSFNQNTQLLEVEGFLKGNYLNANQLMHVTGYDDYQIEKIEILKNPYKLRLKSKKSTQNLLKQQIQKEQHKSFINGGEQSMLEESTIQSQKIQGLDLDKDIILTQHSDPSLQEPLQRIVKKDQNHFVIKDGNILNAIDDDENKNNQEHDLVEENQTNNMQEQQQQNPQNVIDQMIKQEKEQRKLKQKQNQIQQGNDEIEMDDEQMQNESDISYDEADDLEQDDMEIQQEKENRKQVQIQDRTEEDLYEDEVEYNGQVALRERYGAYKYLKSFKTSEWDPLDNLPDPYELIYTFKHYQKTKRLAMEYAQEQAFAYAGFYVKIYLKNFPVSLLQNHNPNTPFILSGLLRHERKMTQVHLKVKKNPEFEQGQFQSKQNVEIHLGFRRFVTAPIYSKLYAGNPKTKYKKTITDNNLYIASFYHPCVYSGNAIIFDNQQNKENAVYGLAGEIFKIDPMHVILKRIVFTGYPHKIHKRRAVIKYMFFQPEDIRYFKPVELKTNLAQRGHIVEPLGTHGLMKCQFGNVIKQHDVIFLQLYKRVYPKNVNFQQIE